MSTVQSIERAFAVLGALTSGPSGVTDIAQRVALPKSTAARLLRSLAREQVVEQIPGETRWRLGPRIVSLAAAVRPTRSLVAVARPYLAALSSATGEAAGLSVPDGNAVHYVDQVESPQPVGVRDWTGTRLPMHAVSSGHVFLAHLRPRDLEAYLAGRLERFTDRTTTDPEGLRQRLRTVQRDGFAWTREEYAEGISSIAAPVAADDGEVVAAVHVHGPSYRFPARGASLDTATAVLDCASSIGGRLRDGR